jgi:voltage-gated potassium channel
MTPQITEKDNFIWLLIGLVLLLFIDAIASQLESRYVQVLVNLSLMLTLFVAVWSLESSSPGSAKWKIGLAAVIAGLMIADSIIESNFLAMGQLAGVFIFLALSVYLAAKQVLFTGTIDRNKIIGAICLYILLGLLWAFAYMITEVLYPGSFNGLDQEIWQSNLEQLIYYSMVTLTTLGYGDVTPELPLARFLAYIEAIIGVFYTTILVASLIGVRLAKYSEQTGDHNRPEE